MKAMYFNRGIKGMMAAALLTAATTAGAGPAAMFGISYTIQSGDVGLTAKVISDNRKNRVVGAAGLSYYPWSPVKKFGIDVSGGYLFDGVAVTAGWDFLKSDYHVAAGYVNVSDEKSGSTPPPSDTGSGGGTDLTGIF